MGKRITSKIKDKIIPLIESHEEINYYLALQLLKSIDGVSLNSAEEWLYMYFKDNYEDDLFAVRYRINKFCRENMSSGRRKKPCNNKGGLGLRELSNTYETIGK